MASKRKGLSHDEKRQKMLELFYEKKDFFQLKELEKLGPKEKGVVSQSVKDVVQSLVDDGLVDTDKIGTSVYFWAFPSKATKMRSDKIEALISQIRSNEEKLEALKQKISQSKVGREGGDEREETLRSLSAIEKQKSFLLSEVEKYKERDPEILCKMKQETKTALTATNRWTDNIFSIKAWCKNKFFIQDEVLNKQFGIPEELDYAD